MKVERWEITSHDEWLERKKGFIGGSETAALHHVHPYLTELKVNMAKRGVEFAYDDNKILRRGRWMEPAVGKAVAELKPDWEVIPAKDFYYDEELKACATPDFYVKGDPRGIGTLQAKSCAPSVYAREWDSGNEVPLSILLQASQEAMLVDAAFAAVAVLVVDPFDMDCRIHEFPRNPAAEFKIKEAIRKFWTDIAEGREPEPDFGKDAELIKTLFPAERVGTSVDVTGNNRIPALIEHRLALQANIKAEQDEVEKIDAELKYTMGDAEVMTGLPPGLRVTFRSTDRAGYSVPAKTMRSLRVFDKREPAV